jgi:hypothetical protein
MTEACLGAPSLISCHGFLVYVVGPRPRMFDALLMVFIEDSGRSPEILGG